ncbi:MAG: CheR family methyltransferase, partial [Thermodesulfobacteriota bacterium]
LKKPMGFDEFLKEVAPLFGLQWRAFRRRGVKRKIERRLAQFGLSHFDEYLIKINEDPEEQVRLSEILTVTISRFYRDRKLFELVENSIIPALIQNKEEKGEFKIWSIGCANGEEPYSLSMLWKAKFENKFPKIRLTILGTDINEALLERAKEGRYKESSLKEVPEEIIKRFFRTEGGFYFIDRSVGESIVFRKHDIIHEGPFPGMDIVFCRNLAFTYFSREYQVNVLKKISESLNEGGYLVIGADEMLPLTYPTLFVPISSTEKIYQRFNQSSPG